MYSRFLYLFIIALLATTPAVAADDSNTTANSATNTTTGATPATNTVKSEEAEPPPEESRVQIPDTPHQEHIGEKPKTGDTAVAKMDGMHDASIPTIRATLMPGPVIDKDKKSDFTIVLHDHEGNILDQDALEEVHTQKIHLLAVDEGLTDYQHIHPKADGDGWSFSFTPKTAHNYKIWIDVKPKNDVPQLLPMFLKGKEPCKGPCVDEKETLTADFGDDKAKLNFDAPLTAGKPGMATLVLTDKAGAPLKDLEPVMGAYAHVAAFSEDFSGVAHVHPQGPEPKNDRDRGAAPLKFMIHPEKPGALKMFVQIRRGGDDVFLPFTASVAAPGKQPSPDSSKKP